MIKIEDMHEISNIVWIPTIPRSRSSMTAGILARCGGWFGNIIYGFHNSRGLYENPSLLQTCWWERIEACGGVKGIAELEKVGHVPKQKYFKETFTVVANYQGYTPDKTLIFKHAPFMFFHEEIMEAFPQSKIIIPERKKSEVIDSMTNLFNLSLEEIESFDSLYRECIEKIKKLYPDITYSLNTDAIAKDRQFAQIEEIVHKIPNLTWNEEAVKKWVNPRRARIKGEQTPAMGPNKNNARGFWI